MFPLFRLGVSRFLCGITLSTGQWRVKVARTKIGAGELAKKRKTNTEGRGGDTLRGAMARNLSSLVHELRERIAASSSSPPNKGDDDALETRFRAVLPNLLHSYVVPSSTGDFLSLPVSVWLVSLIVLYEYSFLLFLSGLANEREVIAVLKLISHTAKNFPGVFYHGKASAVLPVIGRVLPFLSEPALR